MTPRDRLVDAGNPLLAQVPARLETGTIDTPGGKLGILTVRTSSTTLTLMLAEADLRNWADGLTALAGQLGSSLVQASVMDITSLKPPGT